MLHYFIRITYEIFWKSLLCSMSLIVIQFSEAALILRKKDSSS